MAKGSSMNLDYDEANVNSEMSITLIVDFDSL